MALLLPVADLAFHKRLGRLLQHLDEPLFWTALTDFLRGHVAFNTWVSMLFRPAMPPLVLSDQAANLGRTDLFADYMGGLYRLDPYYAFCDRLPEAGVYQLDEVAPDSFRDTEYFRRYFSLNVVEDEVQFLAPLPSVGTVSLSLGSERRFDRDDIGTLCLFSPWIIALMRHSATAAGGRIGVDRVHPNEDPLEDRLRRRGQPQLTEREIEVATLLLAGHSTKGIANKLGISVETAKVHRRNLYAKLRISTQAELFLLFTSR